VKSRAPYARAHAPRRETGEGEVAMSTANRASTPGTTDSTPMHPPPRRWRVDDIVVASVMGVTFGVLFALWNVFVYPIVAGPVAGSLLAPLLSGIWLVPGVVGGLALRRGGVAFYTELVAATVSMLFGSVWGLKSHVSSRLGFGCD